VLVGGLSHSRIAAAAAVGEKFHLRHPHLHFATAAASHFALAASNLQI